MNIFILEDDPGRMAWFNKRLEDHNVTHAESCSQVDRFVGPYDLVFFDHDLGGRQMDEHEDDGAAFATAVAARIGDASVIIHSYNPDGAQHIQAVIGGGFLAPFRFAFFNNLVDMLTRTKG